MAPLTAQSYALFPIPASEFLQGQQWHVSTTVLTAALTLRLSAPPAIPALSPLVPAVSAIQLLRSTFQLLKTPVSPVPL